MDTLQQTKKMLTGIAWLSLFFLSLYSVCGVEAIHKPYTIIQKAITGAGDYRDILKGLSEIKRLISYNRGRKECWSLNREIKNVALRKKTVKTSQFQNDNTYGPKNALNGALDDVFATKLETEPAFRVDLGRMYNIFEVEIYNRKDNSHERFRDVDIRVGRSMKYLKRCGHYKGPATKGERVIIRCPKVMTARFVELKIIKHRTYLNFAEVMVWGTET